MAGPDVDDALARLEAAGSDSERLAIEAELIEPTDNRPRDEDGMQPEDLR